MHNLDLILTLTGGLAAALALGYVTHRLGLSPIVGYLLAGIVVGPYTPGFTADRHLAEQMAEQLGLEVILGAFTAGVILSLVDHDTLMTHPHLRTKLGGTGFGFFVPVFFVGVGLTFDLDALFASASAVLVPGSIAASVPSRPARTSPNADARNHAPIIVPTTRGTDSVVTAESPMGDSIISPSVSTK